MNDRKIGSAIFLSAIFLSAIFLSAIFLSAIFLSAIFLLAIFISARPGGRNNDQSLKLKPTLIRISWRQYPMSFQTTSAGKISP